MRLFYSSRFVESLKFLTVNLAPNERKIKW